jgi:hypothetical protein
VLRRIEIDSPGMAEYALARHIRQFNERIEAGSSKTVHLFATARTNLSRFTPTEPLSVRVVAEFEANGKRFQEVYLLRNV